MGVLNDNCCGSFGRDNGDNWIIILIIIAVVILLFCNNDRW
jgi:hypothetical protein